MTHGFQDEEILGKPYDARLVRRLLSFVRPYTKPVVVAIGMLLVVAGFELTLPYLTKLAIDDYIVARAREVRVEGGGTEFGAEFLRAHAADLVPLDESGGGGARAYVVPSKVLSKYDPREVARATTDGLITDATYYLADREAVERAGIAGSPGVIAAGDRVAVSRDRLAALSKEQIAILRDRDFRGVRNVAAFFLVALVLTFVFTLLQITMMEITSQRVMYDIRMRVLAHLQKLSLSFFDKNPVGRLVTRATNDVEVLHEMFTSIVITLLRDVFTLIGVVILLLNLNWRLALVSFAVLPAMVWATAVFSVRIRDAFREVRVRVARINATLQESISGIRITQIFRREFESFARFARINHDLYRANMRQLKVFALFMPLMELASSIAIALVIWYGGGRVLQSTLSLGTLVAFLAYVQMFFRPIRNLAEQYSTMQSTMASSERIFLLLDNQEAIPEPARPVRPAKVDGRIVFENVWFSYDGVEDVLRDV
jgi:ABC-type multidrug transport system fused ATPase/permease subunit